MLALRRQTNAADIVHLQLSGCLVRSVTVRLFDRTQRLPFFFGEENRLVFLTAYSAFNRGRGGIVVADYFAERQPDDTWKLWLDERPALDDEMLGQWVTGIETAPGSDSRAQLKPFDSAHALLLWEGLTECRFLFRQETAAAAEWVAPWSLLSHPFLPPAIALQLAADRAQVKGMEPLPVIARLIATAGVTR